MKQLTRSKRQHLTPEMFKEMKRAIEVKRKTTRFSDLAKRFKCGMATIYLVNRCKDFDEYKETRFRYSTGTPKVKQVDLFDGVKHDEPKQEVVATPVLQQEQPQPRSEMSVLIDAVLALTIEIKHLRTVEDEKLTREIEELRKGMKDLRDRIAVANQLRASQIHKASEEEKKGEHVEVKNGKATNKRTKSKVLEGANGSKNARNFSTTQPAAH